ncbi:hypothetical protein DFS34DRAFT_652253 [Phlyctochytrium arcticum]|nr:hypothetical protein DFS34DRAFT_652253 [Phlyctochytrium arcticum]
MSGSLTDGLRNRFNLRIVAVVVGLTTASGFAMSQRSLFFNPTLNLAHHHRIEDPYSWNNVKPNQNLKLYDVSRRFESMDEHSGPRRDY